MADKKSKLEINKELLIQLEQKRENLDHQIENLRLRIKNQERAERTKKR
jgi:hypothetical protein